MNNLYVGHEFEPRAPDLSTEYKQFGADYEYVAPSRPESIPRKAAPDFSVAYELKDIAHSTSGEMTGEKAKVQVDRDIYEWLESDGRDIERFVIVEGDVSIAGSKSEAQYSLAPADADSRTSLKRLHQVLEDERLGVKEVVLTGFEKSSLELTAEDDAAAVTGMKALVRDLYGPMPPVPASTVTSPGKSGPHRVSIDSAEGLKVTAGPAAGSSPLGDSADQLFATGDKLRGKGIQVTALRLKSGGIDVRVKDSAGVKDVLSAVQKSDSGVPADEDVYIGPVGEEYISSGLTAEEWAQYSELYGNMLNAGYAGLEVNGSPGAGIHEFDLRETSAGSPLEPKVRQIIIGQLRATGWDGVAEFMLSDGNHLHLSAAPEK